MSSVLLFDLLIFLYYLITVLYRMCPGYKNTVICARIWAFALKKKKPGYRDN